MISVLTQERLLGAALGSITTGIIVFEQRKSIYNLISENQSHHNPHHQMQEPKFEMKTDVDLAHLWNKMVDQTVGPVVAYLSSHGW